MKKSNRFDPSRIDEKQRKYRESRKKSTVEDLFEKFLKEKKYLKNLSERTLSSYKEIFEERWIRFVGYEMPDKENLTKFVMGMREAGFSPTTVNISIRSFNSFLSWLFENDHVKNHWKIKQVKEIKRTMKTFSDGQLQILLNWRPNTKSRNEVRLHVLMYLLVDTGVRINEALTLKVSKVNLDSLVITVLGKGNKERTIPISIEMRKVLYRYLNKYRQSLFPSPWVFCNSSGTHWSYQNACRELMKLCRKLDVDMEDIDGVFHAFRRKFARNYVKQGGNLFYLQQIMGHTTLAMTKAYVSADDEDLAQAHQKTSFLSKFLGRR